MTKKKETGNEATLEGVPEPHGDTGGSIYQISLNESLLEALRTKFGRNKLRRILGLPDEPDEEDV